MFDGITVRAPAKINLGLKVYQGRQDGFHNIESIFTTVGIWDALTVTVKGEDNTCVVECDQMNLSGENTITKAYKAFCVLTGIKKGICVKLEKHIPAGGGLGGGSSDASSFIQSIDEIFSTHLSCDQMLQIAAQVGSDVFFFTKALQETGGYSESKGFTAVVKGRGEIMEAVTDRRDFHVLLLFPGIGVSTKEAYALVDEWAAIYQTDLDNLHEKVDLKKVWEKDVKNWSFVNDFTAPVCAKYGILSDALTDIRNSGADFSDMTGSGSTLYGVYSSVTSARKAQEQLSRKWSVVLV